MRALGLILKSLSAFELESDGETDDHKTDCEVVVSLIAYYTCSDGWNDVKFYFHGLYGGLGEYAPDGTVMRSNQYGVTLIDFASVFTSILQSINGPPSHIRIGFISVDVDIGIVW